jgi:succinate dehydrogenase / fumarate reductase cytochrome b subunit
MSIGTTLKSSIGAKALMAVTGIILVLFVIGHMLGNLQVYLGADALNAYAAKLQSLGPLLWVIRLVLLGTFLAHLSAAMRVVKLNKAARPVAYQQQKDQATTFAARTMWVSGVLVLLFAIYHVLHLTVGVVDPAGAYGALDSEGRHDVYGMVIAGFQHWPTTAIYTVAMVVLSLHVSHGASSMLQTLGLRRPGNASGFDKVGPALAIFLLIGNLSMPLSILAGLVG